MVDTHDIRRAQQALVAVLTRNRGELDAQRLRDLLAPVWGAGVSPDSFKTGLPAKLARPS